MEELIQQWLDENGAFSVGVTLYQSTGQRAYQSKFAKALKKRWVDPEEKALLRRLLEKYVQYDQKEEQKYVPIPDRSHAEEKVEVSNSREEPAEIKSLRDLAIPLHKEYSHLKAELYLMTTDKDKYNDKDRYEVAKKIMEDVLPETDEIYDQIKAWQEDGILPTSPQDDVVKQTVEKMQRVYSLRPRISRLKKWVSGDDLNDEKRKEYEKELLEKELELASLEKELGL